ncbi:Hypothetical predicted protein [Prunus dulcis]|uniref:Uncharacterized protein n=1 Tax=Prunus dulcis TaxID=3755 RepID=A0A5E4G509_PRUDU|nr:Hypothetical predicted protein [Prunus dulcis]
MEKKSQSLENKSRSTKTILSESELDDEPFTEEDLQAIEAAFEAATSSSLPKKRRSSPDDDSDGDDKTQQHHCRIARRRLPSSVLALQSKRILSLPLPSREGKQHNDFRFSCYGATPEVLERLYKVIQSLANLVQQYFRLDGTPGSFYEYTVHMIMISLKERFHRKYFTRGVWDHKELKFMKLVQLV